MRTALLIPLATLFSPGLSAQPIADIEVDLDAVTVVAPWMERDGTAASDDWLGEFSLNGSAERILDNGVRLRARTALRVQYDQPETPGTTASPAPNLLAPGAVSGLAGGLPSESDALRARFEVAYLQADGGYGEVRIGKDRGVAARFHEGAPDALSHARLDSPLLDISGTGSLRTRHDLTGPSAKISYATPRLLGIRAGVSFTPSADADGLDRRIGLDRGGLAGGLDNAVEVAANASRLFPEAGLRLSAALGWSTAELTPASAALAPAYRDRVDTLSAGGNAEIANWRVGGSWLRSDDGLQDADYESWSVGVAREAYGLDWSLGYGEADQDTRGFGLSGWRFAARRELNNGTDIAIAYLNDETNWLSGKAESEGVVVEITLSTEILEISRF